MPFLIDGYNLLYAMGVLRGRVGPTGLLKARTALLGLLRGGFGDNGAPVTVVFDAAHAPAGADNEHDYHGIKVRFATGQEQADDLIESLIGHDSAPRKLTVISDDHRIQQAAQRRHCTVLGCLEFLEWLERHRRERRQPSPEEASKPEEVSEEETQHWLRKFASLQNDPDLKALSDPPEWQESDS